MNERATRGVSILNTHKVEEGGVCDVKETYAPPRTLPFVWSTGVKQADHQQAAVVDRSVELIIIWRWSFMMNDGWPHCNNPTAKCFCADGPAP